MMALGVKGASEGNPGSARVVLGVSGATQRTQREVWEELEGRAWAELVGREVMGVIQTTVLGVPEVSEACPWELVAMEAREETESSERPDL